MYALKQVDLNNVVFIDIETAQLVKPLQPNTPLYDSWEYKMIHSREGKSNPEGLNIIEQFNTDAPLHPEFAKVVCITIGKIKEGVLKLKSFYNHSEKQLLIEFTTALNNITAANKKTVLCGHAIKGFDIPFIMRRCIINQIPLPTLIDIGHLKPWEQTTLDTYELWKAGGFNAGSLINIAVALDLKNPKDDIEGHDVSGVYYAGGEGQEALERIKTYCEKDVLTVANIVMRMRYEDLVDCEITTEIKEKKVGLLERAFNTKTLAKEDEKQIVNTLKTLSAGEEIKAKEILDVCIK